MVRTRQMTIDTNSTAPTFSVEFTAPRNDTADHYQTSINGIIALGEKCLQIADIDYFTVTSSHRYSDPLHTIDIAKTLRDALQRPVVPHIRSSVLTMECAVKMVELCDSQALNRVLIVTGDYAKQVATTPFPYASYLVDYLSKQTHVDLEIDVGCYPALHPESTDLEQELEWLQHKFSCGATRAVSQFFFGEQVFLDFASAFTRRGLAQDIVPGIIPVVSLKQVLAASKNCGVSAVEDIVTYLSNFSESEQEQAGLDYQLRQSRQLVNAGYSHFHLYSLNRSKLLLPTLTALASANF